jgi:hypothetical protein
VWPGAAKITSIRLATYRHGGSFSSTITDCRISMSDPWQAPIIVSDKLMTWKPHTFFLDMLKGEGLYTCKTCITYINSN